MTLMMIDFEVFEKDRWCGPFFFFVVNIFLFLFLVETDFFFEKQMKFKQDEREKASRR